MWKPRLVALMIESGLSVDSLDDAQMAELDEACANGSYIPALKVDRALVDLPNTLHPHQLIAIATMISYIRSFGNGQYELVELPEMKPRLAKLEKKAKAARKRHVLDGKNEIHLRTIYDVMAYAATDIFQTPELAANMFKAELECAQDAGVLPK